VLELVDRCFHLFGRASRCRHHNAGEIHEHERIAEEKRFDGNYVRLVC
jgi:hypothetical protein